MATAIPKAYLASSAIRCRDVETGPNLGVLAVFPSTGATCRGPYAPSRTLHGVSWAQFPRFGGAGSEEAPIEGLASVRRSNGTCGFPAYRFHKAAWGQRDGRC